MQFPTMCVCVAYRWSPDANRSRQQNRNFQFSYSADNMFRDLWWTRWIDLKTSKFFLISKNFFWNFSSFFLIGPISENKRSFRQRPIASQMIVLSLSLCINNIISVLLLSSTLMISFIRKTKTFVCVYRLLLNKKTKSRRGRVSFTTRQGRSRS